MKRKHWKIPFSAHVRWVDGHPSGTIYGGYERRSAVEKLGYKSAFSLISKYRFRTKEVISSG
jgi:hypothetical protein